MFQANIESSTAEMEHVIHHLWLHSIFLCQWSRAGGHALAFASYVRSLNAKEKSHSGHMILRIMTVALIALGS